MTDFPDIPDFLKVANRRPLSPELQARLAEQKPKRPRTRKPAFGLPQNMAPESLALWKEEEKRKAAALKARFAALRERRK